MEDEQTKKAITELIGKSRNVLIALPQNPSTDAVASGLGLYAALQKIGKKVRVVCAEFSLPPHHQFLPKSKEIVSDLTALRKFVITLDTNRTKVEELSYDMHEDKLHIYIKPKAGFFDQRDVSTSATDYEYDLVYVLDAQTLESLGKLFDENAEFFYQTPIINVDHKPTNTYFGQINIIDLVATSTSEILFEHIRGLGQNVLDEYIATNLLAGIISKTKSFQSMTVTPRSLAIASHLIEQGARRDEIIRNLYQTKSIAALKLWGRALARLRTDLDGRLVWTEVTRQDFEISGAAERDLEGVIDELIINTPAAEVIALFSERAGGEVGVLVTTVQKVDALHLFRDYKPTGTKNFARMTLRGTTMQQAQDAIIQRVREYYQAH